MKFTLYTQDLTNPKTDCLIMGIFEKNELTPSVKHFNSLSQGYIEKLIKQDDFRGKKGETLFLHHVPHLNAARILLVGCGKQHPLTAGQYRHILASSTKALLSSQIKHAVSCLTELEVEKTSSEWKVKHAVEASYGAFYRFDSFKSEKEPRPLLQEISLLIPQQTRLANCQKALNQGLCIAHGIEFTKNLANMPSNICTPDYLAAQAKTFVKTHKTLSIDILEESDMKKLGMGAFLAVAKGSSQNAKLVVIHYKGTVKKQAPIALVGKGITFDTGGISLKPAEAMNGMKYDMCGTATVLGVLKAAAELKLPLNLIGVLAIAENMPDGGATKPEDIVTSLSGQTIEIMNTDAEGRLVLCDALTYCERYKPAVVIDIATLTGAVVIALGHHATGLISNHDPLAKDLTEAGIESHDRVWQLPLWEEYQEQIKSPYADMSNVGGRAAGTITAGCFLSRFTKKFHWAHLDVAGTAAMMGSNSERYATGRPVSLLVQYLINQCKK